LAFHRLGTAANQPTEDFRLAVFTRNQVS